MSSEPEQVFRNRPLTAEEAARDNEVRRAVQAEVPPATASHEPRSDSLGEFPQTTDRDSPQPEAE